MTLVDRESPFRVIHRQHFLNVSSSSKGFSLPVSIRQRIVRSIEKIVRTRWTESRRCSTLNAETSIESRDRSLLVHINSQDIRRDILTFGPSNNMLWTWETSRYNGSISEDWFDWSNTFSVKLLFCEFVETSKLETRRRCVCCVLLLFCCCCVCVCVLLSCIFFFQSWLIESTDLNKCNLSNIHTQQQQQQHHKNTFFMTFAQKTVSCEHLKKIQDRILMGLNQSSKKFKKWTSNHNCSSHNGQSWTKTVSSTSRRIGGSREVRRARWALGRTWIGAGREGVAEYEGQRIVSISSVDVGTW